MKGMHTANKVHTPIIHSSNRRTERVMANHAENGMAITSPAL